MGTLVGLCLSLGVCLEAIWVRFLVGFRCEGTYHMVNPGPRSGLDWTYRWNMARGLL
jgi:hypothetical protein